MLHLRIIKSTLFHNFKTVVFDKQILIFSIYRNVFQKTSESKTVPRKQFSKLVEEFQGIYSSLHK